MNEVLYDAYLENELKRRNEHPELTTRSNTENGQLDNEALVMRRYQDFYKPYQGTKRRVDNEIFFDEQQRSEPEQRHQQQYAYEGV